jgi:hypothetical protein
MDLKEKLVSSFLAFENGVDLKQSRLLRIMDYLKKRTKLGNTLHFIKF